MIPQEKTYPFFESNQVLTNDHLNQMLEYLDEQNRLTRTNLVGVGIACGLELQWDGTHVHISKGVGVTSEGYLLRIGKKKKGSLLEEEGFSTDKYRSYTVPKEPNYGPFYEQGDTEANQHEIWELVDPASSNYDTAQKLSGAFLSDKVALLHVELKDDPLKNCSPNSCDDKGREVEITARKLLVTKEIAEKIQAIVETTHPLPNLPKRLDLPDVRLPRFNLADEQLSTASDIFTFYEKMLLTSGQTVFDKLGDALAKAHAAFLPVLKPRPGLNLSFTWKLQMLENGFRNLFGPQFGKILGKSFGSRYPVYFAQYYYDFLCDLIQAYDEFRWKGQELMAMCSPPKEIFPRHLYLGEVMDSDAIGQKVWRHYFRPSKAVARNEVTVQEVQLLFNRLELMVEHFRLTHRPPEGIQITPSRYGDFPLSKKSIPYYLRPNSSKGWLHENWNFELTRTGRADQNLGYHANDYATDDFVKNPLEYDLEGYNFFRVEGHIGKAWRRVLDDILDAKKEHRLPFDVIVLNAGNADVDKDNPWLERCIDNDLDTIYRIWTNEVNCLYRKKLGYLAGRQYKVPTTTAKTKTIIPKEATPPSGTISRDTQPAIGTFTAVGGAMAIPSATITALLSGGSKSRVFETKRMEVSSPTVLEEVKKKEGTLGNILGKQLEREEVKSADQLKREMNKELQQDEAVANLSMKEYKIVAEQPVNLMAGMLELSDAMSKSPKNTDFLELDKKFDKFDGYLKDYLDDLQRYDPNANDATLTEDDVNEMIKELQSLQSKCLRQRLAELRKEMEEKQKAIDHLIYFSRYAQKHPDLQHRAGVPVGGTFILVFKETETAPQESKSKVTFGSGFGATLLPKPRPILPGNFLRRYTIPEGVVIADFFLPYRCCSDCPPVQFVLPPSRPVFNVDIDCTDENGNAAVKIDVTHGILPFEVKVDGGEYQLFVESITLPVGDHTLVVRDAEGGESLPKKITIDPGMALTMEEFNCAEGNETYSVRIRIENGVAPFTLNGEAVDVTPSEVEGEENVFFFTVSDLPAGQKSTLEIGDGSGCDPRTLEPEHTCEAQPLEPQPDTADTEFGTAVTVDVLDNDSGENLKVNSATLDTAAFGEAKVNEDSTITFTPSPAAAGKDVVVTYEVVDGTGATATSTLTISVGEKPCELPCGGRVMDGGYHLWLQPVGEGQEFTEFEAKVTRLRVNNNQQIPTDDFVLDATPNQLTKQFETAVGKWVQQINARVKENVPADQKDWWSMSFQTSRIGFGHFRIGHFACHDFEIAIEGTYVRDKAKIKFTVKYSPKGGTVITETVLNRTSTTAMLPFNRITMNRCVADPTPEPICKPTALPKVNIKVNKIQRQDNLVLVSLQGVALSSRIKFWAWDLDGGVSENPNAQNPVAVFKKGQRNTQMVRVFGFTKDGCMGTATFEVDLEA